MRPEDALALRGPAWDDAVRHFANEILEEYSRTGGDMAHIDVKALAASRDTSVEWVEAIDGEARLLPAVDGFTILVQEALPITRPSRYRTAIVHELGHIFFYDRTSDVPKRRIPWTYAEERFCFSVARKVLINPHAVGSLGLKHEEPFSLWLHRITTELHVSNEIAAKAITKDLHVPNVVFAVWERHAGDWKNIARRTFASPNLSKSQKEVLLARLKAHLSGATRDTDDDIVSYVVPDGSAAFAAIQVRPRRELARKEIPLHVPRNTKQAKLGLGSDS